MYVGCKFKASCTAESVRVLYVTPTSRDSVVAVLTCIINSAL